MPLPTILGYDFLCARKSTLWNDTSLDQNFQGYLGAIGPHEFQGKSVWTNPLVPCFQGKSVWTNGAEGLPKVSPETGIGPWMALPSCDKQKTPRT